MKCITKPINQDMLQTNSYSLESQCMKICIKYLHNTNYIISDTNWLGKIKEKELELDVLHIVRVSKGLTSFMGNCLNL